MRRASSLGLGWVLLGLVSCVPPYEPPRADQPHALVKFRRTYDQTAGSHLAETVLIDDHLALRGRESSAVAATSRTDALLAHPVPSTFVVRSAFVHVEPRWVSESYQVSVPESHMESYSCGFGAQARTCTRFVNTTRYETRYRTVLRQVEVSDGECGRRLRFFPRDGGTYLLQYTYQADQVCSLSCFEQRQRSEGGFESRRCPAAPPETD